MRGFVPGIDEDRLNQALAVARQQSAKLWELRGRDQPCTALDGQGKRKEAHDLLAMICSSLTEGFDAHDLKESGALLNGLA